MALHVSPAEFSDRRARACAVLDVAGLDRLLCFCQETMYWLAGYDTFG